MVSNETTTSIDALGQRQAGARSVEKADAARLAVGGARVIDRRDVDVDADARSAPPRRAARCRSPRRRRRRARACRPRSAARRRSGASARTRFRPLQPGRKRSPVKVSSAMARATTAALRERRRAQVNAVILPDQRRRKPCPEVASREKSAPSRQGAVRRPASRLSRKPPVFERRPR